MITVQLRSGSIAGNIIADYTAYATSCKFSRNLHGAASLDMTVPRALADASRVYSAVGLTFVVVHSGAQLVWSGRLANPELWSGVDGSGVVIRAYGLWEALDDVPYTALWSDTSVSEWTPLDETTVANNAPKRFAIDNNNRLYIAPQKNATVGSSLIGRIGYQLPSQTALPISTVSFDFEYSADANWAVGCQTWDGIATPWTFIANAWTVAIGAPGVVTGSVSATLTGTPNALAFYLYYNAAPAVYIGETGAVYLEITNIRVKTTTASTVTASTVAADLATRVNAVNSSLISSTALTVNPGFDLTDLLFEDARPTQVLNEIASYGDGAGTIYTAGVTNEGQIYLQPIGYNGRTWYVDVTDLTVSADRTKIGNSVYAVYKDANGRALRTATSINPASITRYGYTRRSAVKVDTTSSTRATEWRDTYLADNAVAPGSAAIEFDRVFAGSGLASLTDVLPGDTIVIRNLPLIYGAGSDIDRARSFRITETEYDPINKRLSVTPETPLPRLDVLVAQGAI